MVSAITAKLGMNFAKNRNGAGEDCLDSKSILLLTLIVKMRNFPVFIGAIMGLGLPLHKKLSTDLTGL